MHILLPSCSDKVGDDATKDFEMTLVEEEKNLQLRQEEGGPGGVDSLCLGKDDVDKMAEARERISGLSAVRKAMKNGDMFSEELFKEKFMVGVIKVTYRILGFGFRLRIA